MIKKTNTLLAGLLLSHIVEADITTALTLYQAFDSTYNNNKAAAYQSALNEHKINALTDIQQGINELHSGQISVMRSLKNLPNVYQSLLDNKFTEEDYEKWLVAANFANNLITALKNTDAPEERDNIIADLSKKWVEYNQKAGELS